MMSNPAASANTSKTVNTSPQVPSPSQSQFGYTSGAENYPQRRSGGTGSFGAGSVSRASPSVSRNNQSLRKQHKGQRRPRLADEDAAAESVSCGFYEVPSPIATTNDFNG